jgi:hypothetical protein
MTHLPSRHKSQNGHVIDPKMAFVLGLQWVDLRQTGTFLLSVR